MYSTNTSRQGVRIHRWECMYNCMSIPHLWRAQGYGMYNACYRAAPFGSREKKRDRLGLYCLTQEQQHGHGGKTKNDDRKPAAMSWDEEPPTKKPSHGSVGKQGLSGSSGSAAPAAGERQSATFEQFQALQQRAKGPRPGHRPGHRQGHWQGHWRARRKGPWRWRCSQHHPGKDQDCSRNMAGSITSGE